MTKNDLIGIEFICEVSNSIYKISEHENNDCVHILWGHEFSNKSSVTYTKDNVLQYFNEGIWKVINKPL